MLYNRGCTVERDSLRAKQVLARYSRKSLDSFLDRPAAPNWPVAADTVAADTVAVAGTVVVATAVRRLVVDRVAVVGVVANRKLGRTIEVVSTGKQAPDVYG